MHTDQEVMITPLQAADDLPDLETLVNSAHSLQQRRIIGRINVGNIGDNRFIRTAEQLNGSRIITTVQAIKNSINACWARCSSVTTGAGEAVAVGVGSTVAVGVDGTTTGCAVQAMFKITMAASITAMRFFITPA